MQLPEDLKHFGVEHEDAFQLVPERTAGQIVGALVAAIVVFLVIRDIALRWWQ